MTKTTTTSLLAVKAALSARKDRSAWDRGVTEYALDLLDNIEAESLDAPVSITKEDLLNGAQDWSQYSYGGSALIYDCDIAERLCSPSELKRCRGGDWRPNRNEEWLDVQARALNQAARRVLAAIRGW